jgi:hypothetical protein
MERKIYLELKAILEGCDSIIDALPFCDDYIYKYPDHENLIKSYVNGKIYTETIDIKTKQSTIYNILKCNDKEEALKKSSQLLKKINDSIYKKTLDRIINQKVYNKRETKIKVVPIKRINKKCPHCRHIMNMPFDTYYVICGYSNPQVGFDWNGCGRDWCFHCNKMLCKKWEKDSLNLEINRMHNHECCLLHSKNNGYDYKNDYCQCNTLSVNRNKSSLLSNYL